MGAALALIAAFIGIDRAVTPAEAARSFEAEHTDRGTTRTLSWAFGISMLAVAVAPLLNRARIGRLRAGPLGWLGVVAMVFGLTLHVWANRTLGTYFTRTLRVTPEQRILEEGPYRLIRHPGYLGSLLFWLGAGLAAGNWTVMTTIAWVMGRAYRARIEGEEKMLADTFGAAYHAYAARTWRLIPLVYLA